jgi:hypothetical protein
MIRGGDGAGAGGNDGERAEAEAEAGEEGEGGGCGAKAKPVLASPHRSSSQDRVGSSNIFDSVRARTSNKQHEYMCHLGSSSVEQCRAGASSRVGQWVDEAASGSTDTFSFQPAIIRGTMECLETLTQAHAARLRLFSFSFCDIFL